jgi:hypothetical protein
MARCSDCTEESAPGRLNGEETGFDRHRQGAHPGQTVPQGLSRISGMRAADRAHETPDLPGKNGLPIRGCAALFAADDAPGIQLKTQSVDGVAMVPSNVRMFATKGQDTNDRARQSPREI